jgi:integrase
MLPLFSAFGLCVILIEKRSRRDMNAIRGLIPVQIAAGIAIDTGKIDEEGRAILKAKYTGMHALRHWYASWCINRKQDGGLELPAKVVQERLGHPSIAVTMDIYGHLFPRGDDEEELAVAENAIFA